ncbi:TolC family protein [uncultured Aquimarina sp.]|uniref:TolC family protein n=1 Tax=uncultured Aquimarina sp. TaxID=575652 RepID=UPI002614ECCD|nr:TolC family protein [uncultured Aquimarina sp.]
MNRECVKKIKIVLLIVLHISIGSKAQTIDKLQLETAYVLAEEHYPLIADKALLDEISKINLQIINRERLPYITHNAEGQIQSENVSLNTGTSNVELPLETFKAFVDMNFDLYNGGLVKAKKEIEKSLLKVNQQNLKVTLRTLQNRVNNLFFTIKLSKQQKELLKTSIDDIESNIRTLQVQYDNGVVLESELSKLKVRQLELQSDTFRLDGDIKAYFAVLQELLGISLSVDTELILPPLNNEMIDGNISRPEQLLYDYQKELLTAQEATIKAGRKPKISLFAQGGIGNPNPLNFTDTETANYALGGIRLQWNLIDWGKGKKERQKLKVEIEQTKVDKETFEFDIASREEEYRQRINALQTQLKNDEQIVTLQQYILKQTETQLNNGIINSNDYITQVNAELSAKQQLELHKVELQQLQIEYLTVFGKL